MKRGKSKLEIVKSLCMAKFFGLKKPIFVSWVLTHRCNLRCKYCNLSQRQKGELSTGQIISIIDQLKLIGTRVISFIGGEPLIREDIRDILEYSSKKGMVLRMFSNGLLVPEKISEVKLLDQLVISLDGEEAVHDNLRGRGSFKNAITAIERAVKEKVKVEISAVLTGHNIGFFKYLLDIANDFGIGVRFQPLNYFFCATLEKDLLPSREKYYSCLKQIILCKKQYPKRIRNSMAGLEYLLSWPRPNGNLTCPSAEIFCRIASNGNLCPCTLLEDSYQGLNCVEVGVDRAFKNLLAGKDTYSKFCGGCWCAGTLELSCLYSLKLSAWHNLIHSARQNYSFSTEATEC